MKRAALLKNIYAILLATICVGGLLAYIFLACPSIPARLGNFVYDAWLRASAQPPEEPAVAVVDIDEASIRKLGQLPWPRTILGDLAAALLDAGAAAIGMDIWLTETDRSSPVMVDALLEKNFDLNLDLSKLPQLALDNDRYLKEIIKDKPVALGGHASFSEGNSMPDFMPQGIELQGDGPLIERNLAEIKGFIPPIPVFSASSPVGILNVHTQKDGIVRSAPLLARAGSNIYPGLALLTLMLAKNADAPKAELLDDNRAQLVLEDMTIPLGRNGSFYPAYYGPARTLPYYSAIDVLERNVDPEKLKNKIIFVGPSAHSQQNVASTPLDPLVPQAEIHATIAQNIISGIGTRNPPHAMAIQICAIFISAFIGACIFRFLSLPAYAALFLALSGLCIAASWLAFQNGFFISPVGAVSALVFTGLAILPFRYWQEQALRRKLRHAFAQYVSPEVVSRIVSEGGNLLKGEHKELTVMFTDVRGFTGISEKLSPSQLVRLLNRYFTPMTACVTARGGTLDKFIGDALMAFWNAPVDVAHHSCQAVLAALDMQAALDRLRPDIQKEFDIDMRMGIGINTGYAHVGNMGSEDLLDYTCIGETVNLASRLEAMCKRYSMKIVVSESVRFNCADSIYFILLDKIRVKGSARPLKIYSPLQNEDIPPPAITKKWQAALDDYFAGNFTKARQAFGELSGSPLLQHAARLFIERCQDLENSPEQDWNGVWTYQEK